ncbi:MAG: phosphatidate cytidylyltransferase [Micromonosporaceae bacterium]|nr:phosphatidate cytidylyltransferase [Micromonosporaceae bacterium]
MSAYSSPSAGGYPQDSHPAYPQRQGSPQRARHEAAPDASYGYPPGGGRNPGAERYPEQGRYPEPGRYPGHHQPVEPGRQAHEPPEGSDEPGPEAKAPGKAGRNLPAAIGVGVTLGALVIASLYVWRPAFVVLAVAAILMGIWEMVRAVEPVEARPPLAPLLVGGGAILVLAWFAGVEAMLVGLVLTVAAVLIWRLGEGPVGYQRDIVSATLIAVYVPFLAGFAILLAQPADGHLRVTITLAAAVLSDVGGYATGVLFGRHPMAPTVSPKKSWEGFAGSMVFTAAGGALMLSLLLGQSWWEGALLGVAVAFAATLGDLCESLMKRDLGIKDMGRLLPGHGGLMDRLDSLLLAAPTGYVLLTLFAPPAA